MTLRSISEAIDILKKNLLDSFQNLQGIHRCGILFSGGIDSSLAAFLARRFCGEVTLLNTCAEGSRDSQSVTEDAKILDLKLIETRMDSESVWNILPELIHAIGRSHRMDVEIALPFFLSTKEAKILGIDDIVSGQGPDELFAGYTKHENLFIEQGEAALKEMLNDETSRIYEVDIQRDEKAISYFGLKAHFPYLDSQFMKVALSLPARWKINPEKSPSRKIIFRQLAIEMGLPLELALKPKAATQYSSGSSRILIDSVKNHVLNFNSLSRNKANIMVQDVLNLIAFELGLPNSQLTSTHLKIDLHPTQEFVSRIQSTNRQQLVEE
jgi:asparagine synthase (glutamine-hydrolysing)